MSNRQPEDDDDSSAHTSRAASSVAATDSDDAGRLEDTAMDPEDFVFPVDQYAPSRDEAVEGVYPLLSPTVGDERLFDNDRRSGGGDGGGAPSPNFGCARRLSTFTGMGGGEGGGLSNGQAEGAAVPPPPSVEDQIVLVRGLIEDEESNKLRPGQSRFLVGLSWMRRWRDYVGWSAIDSTFPGPSLAIDPPPGPITNEDILEADGVTLQENQDCYVECLTGKMWGLLSGWYGGTPIERFVIEDGGAAIVEMYQLKLKLTRKGGESLDMVLSKSCTVGDLRREGIAELQMGSLEDCLGLRLYEMSGTLKLRELNDDAETLSQFFVLNDACVQFELPGDNDNVVGGVSRYSSMWRSGYSTSRRTATPGAVGLNNLGNTCFMNAAIQCLSHIPQVVSYFGETDGRQPFLEDLNIENPLGTKGQLAKAFGDLVRVMWSGKDRCIYPRDFRDVLCDHAQQFLGYEQHDSQEFLAYLLDGIHEDVNRVREKPFVEKVEAVSGECDETAAHRAWEAHLQRNDSFIVDTMHGQYKSVVTCPVAGCGKTSTTFDPAMYLSVPLPVTAEKSVELTLATLDGRRPKRYVVWVSQMAKVKELKQALSKACGKSEERLVFADVWQHKIQAVLEDDQSVTSIHLDDLFVFELPEWPQPPPLPADDCASDLGDSGSRREFSAGGASAIGGRWEQKLEPFLLRTLREKMLRNGSDADGRSRLLEEAKTYLDRFPSMQELAELTRSQEIEANGNGCSELGGDLERRLREASDYRCSFTRCSFTELNTLEQLAGFGEAVQSLKELVLHEQRDVRVQIIQHRSSDLDTFKRCRSYSQTMPFCFPLLFAYLPHSTTVGEFRSRLAVVLRRLVPPRDTANKGGGKELVSGVEKGESAVTMDDNQLNPAQDGSSEPEAGDPDSVVQLFRSGQLELLAEDPPKGYMGNILSGGEDLDGELISYWLENSPHRVAKIMLKWSDGALREAFDATEVHQVVDDPSVEACRNRTPTTLSVSQCLEHFLEREQLDESEMWYCSSCKEHRRAYKELSLWRLPPVLVMHLKRFSYDTYGGWASSREKIESFVSFPVRGLDMRKLERLSQERVGGPKQNGASATASGGLASSGSSGEDCHMDDWVVVDAQQQSALDGAVGPASKEVDGHAVLEEGTEQSSRSEPAGGAEEAGGAVYDLWGVVNHYGGLNGGHYTAFALNKHDNRWYDFSDDRVLAMENESDLVTSAAYVLFYQRRGGGAGAEAGDDSKDTAKYSKGAEDDVPSSSVGIVDGCVYVRDVGI